MNALYGASHIIAKGIMPDYLKANVFVLFRAVGATILFWLIRLLFIREKVERKDLLLLAACGLFGVTINQLCFLNGLNLSSSINSGIIMTVNPILVIILSYFILKEAITLRKSLGVAIGATGAILLTLTAGTGSDSMLGDMLLLVNATSYALYMVLVKPITKKYKPLTIITYVFTFGMTYVILFPPTLIELSQVDFSLFDSTVIWKIAFVIVGVTFLTYLLTSYGLKFLSPSVSSVYIYLQPVLVMIFAYVLSAIGIADDYTDSITWEKIGYMLVIFVGVYLTSSTSFKRKKAN